MLILPGTVAAAAFEQVAESPELKATITLPEASPAQGTSALFVDVVDAQGTPVTDATVKVRFKMKPRAGMMPMNTTSPIELSGTRYAARMKFGMPGEWVVEVRIKRGGSKALKAKFPVMIRP